AAAACTSLGGKSPRQRIRCSPAAPSSGNDDDVCLNTTSDATLPALVTSVSGTEVAWRGSLFNVQMRRP
ncbi:hypothetical protein CH063_15484, partial [Colletotrichum higginsianum]